jgi:hypothetical protein
MNATPIYSEIISAPMSPSSHASMDAKTFSRETILRIASGISDGAGDVVGQVFLPR